MKSDKNSNHAPADALKRLQAKTAAHEKLKSEMLT